MKNPKTKEELFRRKAESYLICFNHGCPQHEHCLRWQVGQYVNPKQTVVNCVNPYYAPAAEGHCDLYRDDQPVTMPVGMKEHFYYDMPARIAQKIKQTLIDHNCRATYYHYHNGTRPISPDYEAFIRQTCQRFGWTQPLQFDSTIEDYVWEEI